MKRQKQLTIISTEDIIMGIITMEKMSVVGERVKTVLASAKHSLLNRRTLSHESFFVSKNSAECQLLTYKLINIQHAIEVIDLMLDDRCIIVRKFISMFLAIEI